MAKVRLGVKRITNGFEVPEYPGPEADDAAIEIFIVWVEINGTRLDTGEIGLISCDHHADGEGASEITLKMFSSGFSTVDHRTEGPDLIAVKSATGDLLALAEDG